MHSNRALRAILLSFLLVLGSLTVFIIPPVEAQSSDERTYLYFTDATSIISTLMGTMEGDSNDIPDDNLFGDITSQMNTTRPIGETSSVWLPPWIG